MPDSQTPLQPIVITVLAPAGMKHLHFEVFCTPITQGGIRLSRRPVTAQPAVSIEFILEQFVQAASAGLIQWERRAEDGATSREPISGHLVIVPPDPAPPATATIITDTA